MCCSQKWIEKTEEKIKKIWYLSWCSKQIWCNHHHISTHISLTMHWKTSDKHRSHLSVTIWAVGRSLHSSHVIQQISFFLTSCFSSFGWDYAIRRISSVRLAFWMQILNAKINLSFTLIDDIRCKTFVFAWDLHFIQF